MNKTPLLRSTRPHAIFTVALAAALTAGLAACDKPGDDRTAGQKLDGAIAGARAAGQDAKDQVGDAAKTAAETVNDTAIVAKVHAAFVADEKLKSHSIDVSCANGRVTLTGTVPDAGAREHAATVAMGVAGVQSVDNQLVVGTTG
ncbi:MAG: BON domain-containing protein [Pelomonas sp.]|nr:BON domain-containing protein [Roseateles sp.]